MDSFNLGPDWFWKLIGILAVIGGIASVIGIIACIAWVVHHVKIV